VVEAFLRALLQDLERRCVVLRDRLAAIPADPDMRDHALGGYQVVERARRDTVQLLTDPALGAPALLSNHLQLYKRGNELATLVESYVLPFVERYNDNDRRLTRLCQQLLAQVHWPLPVPLVVSVSSQYYWTQPSFNLICVPAAEDSTLLGLPDLCHELAHLLFLHHEALLIGDFLQHLTVHITHAQQQHIDAGQHPEDQTLYNHLFTQWSDAWVQEFVADMVATYLVGPAFGWQHIRLCAGRGQAAYSPSLGETAEHPADEARLRGVVAVLTHMKAEPLAVRVQELWTRYVNISGETPTPDYAQCYPQELITVLAERVVDGCRALGLRSFTQEADPPGTQDIPALLVEAWEQFLGNPQSYLNWERVQLETLWRGLGFGKPKH
jgi:hypothetical protein